MDRLSIVKAECKVCPGTDIKYAIQEALRFAMDHDCIVTFSFNDIPFRLSPSSKVDKVFNEYTRRLHQSPIR